MNSDIEKLSWWTLTRRILFSPRTFFAQESQSPLSYRASVIYLAKTTLVASLINTVLVTAIFYVLLGSLASLLAAFTTIFGTLLTPLIAVALNIAPEKVPGAVASFAKNGELQAVMTSVRLGAFLLVGYLSTIVISTCVQAGIAHCIARLMGSAGSFRATVAAYSFGSAAWLLSVVPIVNVFAPVYGAALNFFGMRQGHQLSGLKATFSVAMAAIFSAAIFMMFGSWYRF